MIYVNGTPIQPNTFPDGTWNLKIPLEIIRPRTTQSVCWKYQNEYEMSILYFITKHLQTKGLKVGLSLPYIPNARMDRVKNHDEVFTLKIFSEFVNSLGFEFVNVLDPHSNVAGALINNIKISSPNDYIEDVIDTLNDSDIALMYPDEGAMKRYSGMPSTKNIPYAFGVKDRDWRSGKINGLTLINSEHIKDKNVLIIDDICSRGGTFYYAAQTLKEAGAKDIYLYITHCENTIFDGELIKSDLVKRIFTTDSILTKKHDKISILG